MNENRKYIGLGIAIGTAVGIAMDNIGLGIATGLVFGVALSNIKNKDKEKNQDS